MKERTVDKPSYSYDICLATIQYRRKRGGRSGLSHPTFLSRLMLTGFCMKEAWLMIVLLYMWLCNMAVFSTSDCTWRSIHKDFQWSKMPREQLSDYRKMCVSALLRALYYYDQWLLHLSQASWYTIVFGRDQRHSLQPGIRKGGNCARGWWIDNTWGRGLVGTSKPPKKRGSKIGRLHYMYMLSTFTVYNSWSCRQRQETIWGEGEGGRVQNSKTSPPTTRYE